MFVKPLSGEVAVVALRRPFLRHVARRRARAADQHAVAGSGVSQRPGDRRAAVRDDLDLRLRGERAGLR